MPNAISSNTSGSADQQLEAEFDLLLQYQINELADALRDLIMHDGMDPLLQAFWLLEKTPNDITDEEYEDSDFAYDEATYDKSQHDYEKQQLLKTHGINIDDFTFDPKWPDTREVGLFLVFIRFNLKKLPQMFKTAYVRRINNITDGEVFRKLVYQSNPEADDVVTKVKLANANLSKVPAYIKKYTALDDIDLSGNNFTTINTEDFPEKIGALDLSYCEKLTTLEPNNIPTTYSLILKGCKNLQKVHYGEINKRAYVIYLNIKETAINSTEQIILPEGDLSDYIFSIKISPSHKSLKCNNTSANIRYLTDQALVNINTFYGMGENTYFYMEHAQGMYDLNLDQYIPNIDSAKDVRKAYDLIYNKYKDFLTNKTLESVYNSIQPKTLDEFEMAINRIKSGNISRQDVKNLALLIRLLKK